ncbi:hypothetical protein [Ectobacillus sp. sgz5001026]|uniref:rolling circle replication-associated protein n=1 Tax=Ectobacillus sp. sgz5001026 TaxID=3242473 RepID=UPI0036D298BD
MLKPHMKITMSNKYVEVTQLSFIPCMNRTSSGGRKPYPNQSTEDYENNKKVAINRARKNIRRYLECNFTDRYAFLTLTFKSSQDIDVTNLNSCQQAFIDFKKRLAYYLQKNDLSKFEYLGVTEFQDKNRGGAIHYHLVCNLIDIPSEVIQELWQYGGINREIIQSDAHGNERITNYIKKGITDDRLNSGHRFFHSRGLKTPISITVEDSEDFYNLLDKCQPTLLHSAEYQTPMFGEIKQEDYYVKNPKELMNYVQEL